MSPTPDLPVAHRTLDLDGLTVFYREAGPDDAPVLVLPHGYPSSSFEFRRLIPELADRYRLVAPDFPGFGYTEDGDAFDPSFDGMTDVLERFLDRRGLTRYALYLHDYGSQVGLRLAIRAPERVTALIIQNGDIYEDELGPKYAGLTDYFAHPTTEGRAALFEAVTKDGYREEFLNGSEAVAERVAPDNWELAWALTTDRRREIAVALMEGLEANLDWFPRYQAYLREHQPPTLIVWGPKDGYMPEGAARAYLRDLPDAELHLIEDGGHWLLETHLREVVALARDFLGRVL